LKYKIKNTIEENNPKVFFEKIDKIDKPPTNYEEI
jgi:hypothetical protein